MQAADALKHLIVLFSLASPSLAAQELPPQMEGYLSLEKFQHREGHIELRVINHYSSALVAIYWEYRCDDSKSPTYRGYSDAALNYAPPVPPNGSLVVGAARAGCSGGFNAVVWADGKEAGNPSALRKFHECRAAASEEMHTALNESVTNKLPKEWSPVASVAWLRERIAGLRESTYVDDQEEVVRRSCQLNVLESMLLAIQEYRSTAIEDEPLKTAQRGAFLRYLMDWEQFLGSDTYNEHVSFWK